MILYKNNAASTLASGITASATSISVASGGGANFPAITGSDFFYATLSNSTGTIEVVKVTARSTDTLTVVRAQEGSTASAFAAGDFIQIRITAGLLDQLKADAVANYLPLSGGTLTGSLTLSGLDYSLNAQSDGSSAAWRGRILSKNATSDVATFLGNYNGKAGIFAHNNALTSWATLYLNTLGSNGSGTAYLPHGATYTLDSSNNTYAVLNAGNYNSYSPTLTGTGASGTWGISINGSAAQLGGYSGSSYSGPTSVVKKFFWNDLSASGTQARTFEIARIGVDYVNWNAGTGPFEVELYESYYSRGLKKKYVIYWGYSNTYGIQLVEYSGSGDNNFQCRIGAPVLVSGNNYYLPVFVDVRYYSYVDVCVTTNRDMTGSNPPAVGTTYINGSPSATNISDFTADSTVNFSSVSTVQINGNQLLHAGNYGSYALPIGGGTLTGGRPITFNTGNGWAYSQGDTGGWAMGHGFYGSSGTFRGGFGALGGGDGLSYFFVGADYNNASMTWTYSDINAIKPITLGGRVNASTFGGNTSGLSGYTFPAEVRASGSKPALTWHYENVATRHIALEANGALNVLNPGESGGAVLQVGGNTVLHAGNSQDYRTRSLNAVRTTNVNFNSLQTAVDTFSAGTNYIPSGGAYNQPADGDHHYLAWGGIEGSTVWGAQIDINFYDDRVWFRRQAGANWQAWRQFIHDGNYSSYALPLSGGTVSGYTTFSSTNDAQIELNGNGSTWAGIKWVDGNGSDYSWFYGATGTWAFGGGGSAVSGKKMHIHGGVTIGSSYAGTSNPTNGLLVEGAIQQSGNQVLHASNYWSYTDSRYMPNSLSVQNFYVGGSPSNYYPVAIAVSSNKAAGWNESQSFEIFRDDVHEDFSSAGSFRLRVYAQGSSWGHRPGQVMRVEYTTGYGTYADAVGDVTAGDYRVTYIMVYLRGGMTYHLKSLEPWVSVYVAIGNSAGGSINTGYVTFGSITSQSSLIVNAKNNMALYGNAVLTSYNYTSYAQAIQTRRRGSSYGQAAYGLGRNAGRDGNCGDFDYGNCNTYLSEDNSNGFDMYYAQRVCYNCNCNCDCCC